MAWAADHRSCVPTPLTGSLEFLILGGMESTLRQLLDLPNGLRSRKLAFSWLHEDDLRWIMELVVRCSHTLDHLSAMCRPSCNSSLASPYLSEATKHRNVVFRPGSSTVTWIIITLRTITPKHVDPWQISVHVPDEFVLIDAGDNVEQAVGESVYRQWIDLDHLLVQLWESRSIHPSVLCTMVGKRGQNRKYCVGCLSPKISDKGIIDLV